MATPWPATLPQEPLMDGNGYSTMSNAVEFKPDMGPPLRRQRTTLVMRLVPWNFMLTEAQKNTFLTYFHTTLKDGTDRGTATDPFTGVVRDFLFEDGYALQMLSPGVYRLSSTLRMVS